MSKPLASRLALALLGGALLGAPALAQPYGPPPPAVSAGALVTVSISPEYAAKAKRIYIDVGDLDLVSRYLKESVESAFKRARPDAPVRLDLVIRDAVPNRPTSAQMGRETSLSFRSIGVGGASVGGTATFADGRVVPVDFTWYETDLRSEIHFSPWGDADEAFQMLAGRLARGELGRSHLGEPSRDGGNFISRYTG